jgi:gliding motility-associated-like protein
MRIIVFICSVLLSLNSYSQLIINEFSNGSSGSKEFFELVVEGSPGSFQDIRNWIVDDHSGFYGCGSGNGIASGHLKFANHQNWQCVPAGSIILLYNPADVNTSISIANDPTDSNNDGVYVLPITTGTYLEGNSSTPSSSSCNSFTGPYSTPGSWSIIALGNGADAAQVIDPSNTSTAHHAVGYGGINGPNPAIYFNGSGSGTNFSFVNTTNDQWSLQANWTSGNASSNDSPGSPNNTANANWLASMALTVDADTTQGCAPFNVNFTTNSNIPGYTYSWDFGDNNSGNGSTTSHTYTTTGSYNAVLTIGTPAGCSIQRTIPISITGGGSVTAPSLNSVCTNQQPFALPGGTPAGGSWSGNGVSSNTFDPQTAGVGTHNLTYTVSGACGGSDQVSITVQNSPNAQFSLQSTTICANADPVNLNNSGGGTFFGNGVANNTFNPSTAGPGSHSIGYAVSNGNCSDTTYQTISVINNPQINWTLPDTICYGQNRTFIGGAAPQGGDYFLNGSQLADDSIDVSNLNVDSTYTLAYSLGSTNCFASDTQIVYIEDNPSVNIQFSGDTIRCNSNPAQLTAAGNGRLIWNNGSNSGSITASTSGTYWAERNNYCGSDREEISFSFYEDPQLSLDENLITICKGEEAVINASSNINDVNWSNGVTGNQIIVNQPGKYTATVTNECGSMSKQTVLQVESPEVKIKHNSVKLKEYDFEAIPSNYDEYSWFIDDVLVETYPDFRYLFSDPGEHEIVVETKTRNSCLASDTVLIELQNIDNVFIPNAFTPNGDGINDRLKIEGEKPQFFEAIVFNRWGEEIARWTDIQDSWDGKYRGKVCADGVYVLKVSYNNQSFIETVQLFTR